MKNYFYFSQTQKIGITILIAFIILLLSINFLIPHLYKKSIYEESAFTTEVELFKKSLQEKETQKKIGVYANKKDINEKLFLFNPNTLDSAGFVSLGIRPKIAHNIIKYRSKGGKFKSASDFKKIYGISDIQMKQLLPYILIPKEEKEKNSIVKIETKIIVELNSCDTSLLKEIKGIGSSFAKRIVKYRTILGGYYCKEQLKEVYGIDNEKFKQIEPFVRIDTSLVKKIDVNKASVEKLKSHQYLNFYSAKAIYEQRKKLGKLNSKNDLNNLKDLPQETLQKISPYLNFEIK